MVDTETSRLEWHGMSWRVPALPVMRARGHVALGGPRRRTFRATVTHSWPRKAVAMAYTSTPPSISGRRIGEPRLEQDTEREVTSRAVRRIEQRDVDDVPMSRLPRAVPRRGGRARDHRHVSELSDEAADAGREKRIAEFAAAVAVESAIESAGAESGDGGAAASSASVAAVASPLPAGRIRARDRRSIRRRRATTTRGRAADADAAPSATISTRTTSISGCRAGDGRPDLAATGAPRRSA